MSLKRIGRSLGSLGGCLGRRHPEIDAEMKPKAAKSPKGNDQHKCVSAATKPPMKRSQSTSSNLQDADRVLSEHTRVLPEKKETEASFTRSRTTHDLYDADKPSLFTKEDKKDLIRQVKAQLKGHTFYVDPAYLHKACDDAKPEGSLYSRRGKSPRREIPVLTIDLDSPSIESQCNPSEGGTSSCANAYQPSSVTSRSSRTTKVSSSGNDYMSINGRSGSSRRAASSGRTSRSGRSEREDSDSSTIKPYSITGSDRYDKFVSSDSPSSRSGTSSSSTITIKRPKENEQLVRPQRPSSTILSSTAPPEEPVSRIVRRDRQESSSISSSTAQPQQASALRIKTSDLLPQRPISSSKSSAILPKQAVPVQTPSSPRPTSSSAISPVKQATMMKPSSPEKSSHRVKNEPFLLFLNTCEVSQVVEDRHLHLDLHRIEGNMEFKVVEIDGAIWFKSKLFDTKVNLKTDVIEVDRSRVSWKDLKMSFKNQTIADGFCKKLIEKGKLKRPLENLHELMNFFCHSNVLKNNTWKQLGASRVIIVRDSKRVERLLVTSNSYLDFHLSAFLHEIAKIELFENRADSIVVKLDSAEFRLEFLENEGNVFYQELKKAWQQAKNKTLASPKASSAFTTTSKEKTEKSTETSGSGTAKTVISNYTKQKPKKSDSNRSSYGIRNLYPLSDNESVSGSMLTREQRINEAFLPMDVLRETESKGWVSPPQKKQRSSSSRVDSSHKQKSPKLSSRSYSRGKRSETTDSGEQDEKFVMNVVDIYQLSRKHSQVLGLTLLQKEILVSLQRMEGKVALMSKGFNELIDVSNDIIQLNKNGCYLAWRDLRFYLRDEEVAEQYFDFMYEDYERPFLMRSYRELYSMIGYYSIFDGQTWPYEQICKVSIVKQQDTDRERLLVFCLTNRFVLDHDLTQIKVCQEVDLSGILTIGYFDNSNSSTTMALRLLPDDCSDLFVEIERLVALRA